MSRERAGQGLAGNDMIRGPACDGIDRLNISQWECHEHKHDPQGTANEQNLIV